VFLRKDDVVMLSDDGACTSYTESFEGVGGDFVSIAISNLDSMNSADSRSRVHQ
jgi:hypothetical protein